MLLIFCKGYKVRELQNTFTKYFEILSAIKLYKTNVLEIIVQYIAILPSIYLHLWQNSWFAVILRGLDKKNCLPSVVLFKIVYCKRCALNFTLVLIKVCNLSLLHIYTFNWLEFETIKLLHTSRSFTLHKGGRLPCSSMNCGCVDIKIVVLFVQTHI